VETVVEVSGMTCNHCVQSVTAHTEKIPGVTEVEIELEKGGNSIVTVTHDGDILADLASAIADAGYTLEAVTKRS
jgi:copper chaperone